MSARPLEQSALSLEWVLGANTSIINGVIDLKDDTRNCFFYPCAHTGILYNVETNSQTLFSGHRHTITAIAVTNDKNYIATADTGENSALIIWDSHTAAPLFTKFSPHPTGVCACAFSAKGQYLVTLSSTLPQVLAIWNWSSVDAEPEPVALVEIPFQEMMTVVQFNPRDETQLVTNGSHSIVFWQWNTSNDEISFYSPPVTARDLKKPIGNLIYSRYLPENDDVVVSTSEGSLIHLVRDPFAIHQGLDAEHKPVKVINLHKSAVTTLEIHKGYIVTGGADGIVKFFDFQFRLIAWFEEIKAGPITSISFSNITATSERDKFSCKPFIIATSNAAVIRLTDAVYYDVTGSDQPEILLRNHTGAVKAIAVNPNDGRIVTGSDAGELIQWDIVNHVAVSRACYDKLQITALCYDPCKDFLTVGFSNGSISVVTTDNFDEKYHQRITKNASITDIQYSSDSSFLAVTLSDNTLALFRSLDKLSPTTPMMSQGNDDSIQMTTIQQERKDWEYVGRHRSHWDQITGLAFIGNGTQESPHRLFTIGRDRRVVEYDYAGSTYLDGVQIKPATQVEMTAHPTSFAWTCKDNRPYFVVSNTEGKLRLWNGAAAMTCRLTVLAPSFGGDITHMVFIENQRASIVYATDSCILGIILYPLTGNPNESMGLIAHPVSIERVVMSRDESRVLVCSGVDNYIGIFTAHPEHLEAAALLAARDGDAFVAMLEGGEDGPLYQEIVDYFYSSQLRVQGKLTDKPHEIPQVVPISEVVPLLCALGYYPTQYEADLIRNEIQYSKFVETNEKTETIDFQTFLRLFLNHRPVVPPSLDEIEHAFKVLGADEEGQLSTEELINLLQSSGEAMSVDDIDKCIEILVGQPLPSHMNSYEFVESVLGLVSGEEEDAGENTQQFQLQQSQEQQDASEDLPSNTDNG